MIWKCWNSENPTVVYEITADSLDVACRTARTLDPSVDSFQPKGDEHNDKDEKFSQ